jgi:hypothetical protein
MFTLLNFYNMLWLIIIITINIVITYKYTPPYAFTA